MYARKQTGCSIRFLMAGPLLVGAVVIIFFVFQQFQVRTPQESLPTETQVADAASAAPTTTVPAKQVTAVPTQKPVTLRIVADKANLLTEVTELYFGKHNDWDLSRLGQLAGHLEGTPGIGQGGNYVLAGHVELKDGSMGPFANIGAMKAGDFISIFSDKPNQPLVMQYTVSTVNTVKPNNIDVIRNHGYEELTLITCSDWDQKTQSYNSRVVVHAVPVTAKQKTVIPPATLSKKTP